MPQNTGEGEVQDGRCTPGIKDTVQTGGHKAFKRGGSRRMKLIKTPAGLEYNQKGV